jgi:hypothetical protein
MSISWGVLPSSVSLVRVRILPHSAYSEPYVQQMHLSLSLSLSPQPLKLERTDRTSAKGGGGGGREREKIIANQIDD